MLDFFWQLWVDGNLFQCFGNDSCLHEQHTHCSSIPQGGTSLKKSPHRKWESTTFLTTFSNKHKHIMLSLSHIIRHICKNFLEMFPTSTSLYQFQLLIKHIHHCWWARIVFVKKTPYLILSFFIIFHVHTIFCFNRHLIQQLRQILLDRTRIGKSLTQVCFLSQQLWLKFWLCSWVFFTHFLGFSLQSSTHSHLQAVEPLCFTLSMLFKAITLNCAVMSLCERNKGM